MIIPAQLAANCSKTPERAAWLSRLPSLVETVTARWSLRPGPPFDHALVSCSWVAPVLRADGSSAILKLAMPHMEGAHEIQGLRYWNGDPTVQLLEFDDALGAMLLERCEPGEMLRSQPEAFQDEIIAGLLKRLHRPRGQTVPGPPFRHLSKMIEHWSRDTLSRAADWPDAALVREGLRLMGELAAPSPADTLLATDLHAGNVLRAQREPWLVIDPKPFIGDPAYDLVQHLHNCESRLHADPIGLVNRLADMAEVDRERARLWTFARAAADPRDDWSNQLWLDIARVLAL